MSINWGLLGQLQPNTAPDVQGMLGKAEDLKGKAQGRYLAEQKEGREAELHPFTVRQESAKTDLLEQSVPLTIEEKKLGIEKSKMDLSKAQLETDLAKTKAIGDAMGTIMFADDAEKPKMYKAVRDRLKQTGMDVSSFPETYDENAAVAVKQALIGSVEASKLYLTKLQQSNKGLELQSKQGQLIQDAAKLRAAGRTDEAAQLEVQAKTGGKPMSAEAVKLSVIADGSLRAVDTLEASLKNGASIMGALAPNMLQSGETQKYETARLNLTDAFGRLRSGGAINSGEETRFEKLMPRLGDSQETIDYKTGEMKFLFSEIKNRIEYGQAATNQGPQGYFLNGQAIDEATIATAAKQSGMSVEAFAKAKGIVKKK